MAQDSGLPFQASRSRSSRFSKDHNDRIHTLLPPFRDTQLATNAASSSNVPLLASSAPCASSLLCLTTSASTSQPSKSSPPTIQVLTLSFCGEEFKYDLDTLENDPKPILELLKATESERGTWITVGAHYRRSGNAIAAIAVVESLIMFMTAQGLPESDLKPAFLLLSGCETDLAKRLKAEQPIDAESHYKRSQALLQKVYGSEENRYSQVSLPAPQSTICSPANNATPKQAPRRLRLECDIQLLLKEKDEQSSLLADVRAAKRKLEDDLAYECNGRRRLLRDYDDLQKELAMARKMETYALGQVKREVDARRQAEEMARTEKKLRMELQSLFEACTTAPFGEIVNTIRSEKTPLFVPPSA
ncbi:hypothetical protein H0H87_000720 [Tephrocybe sp. NHM501043]|nr:hypothetical protein H0H87_000720 [Tephrocybe sp. NHM501043]